MMSFFVKAKYPTPIFNRADISFTLGLYDGQLFLDQQYLFRPLEMIAFEESIFKVINSNGYIYEVTTDIYPSTCRLYIDCRFVEKTKQSTTQLKHITDASAIIANLLSAKGNPYIWGGNYKKGIKQMLKFYPPIKPLSPIEHKQYVISGVDCSGLLYEATNGLTPRNTSWLYEFGKPVLLEGKSYSSVDIKPLDLWMYKGHVLIVIDEHTVIEAKEKFGVYLSSAKERLKGFFKKYKPSNKWIDDDATFIIRRWHEHINAT